MVQAMACNLTKVGDWQMGCSHQERSNLVRYKGRIDIRSLYLNKKRGAANRRPSEKKVIGLLTQDY